MIFSKIIYFAILIIFSLFTTGNTSTSGDTVNVLPTIIDLSKKPEGLITIVPPAGVAGFRIRKIVDLNKDGYDDIIISGNFDYTSEDYGFKTIIYILYGQSNMPAVIHIDNPEVEVAKIIWPNTNKDLQISNRFVTTGDVDGNGFKDVIFSADKLINPLVDYSTSLRFETRIYMLLATSVWRGETVLAFNDPNLKEVTISMTEKGYATTFISSLIADDFDGNMKDDVAFVVPQKYVNDIMSIGQIYIIHGNSTFPHEFDTENTIVTTTKIKGDTSFGINKISVGDLDGDSQPDLLIEGKTNRKARWPFQTIGFVDSTIYYKTLYVAYGSVLRNFYFLQPVSTLMSSIWGLSVFKSFDVSNYHSLYAGDITGDGCDEFFVGYNSAPSSFYPGKNFSNTCVVLGSRDFLFGADINKINRGIVRLKPFNQNEYMAHDQVSYADINGDGYEDALISSNDDTHYQFYILYGRPNFPDSIILSNGSPYITNVINGDVSGCGDVNGDGYQDIVGEWSPYILLGRGVKHEIGESITRNITKSKNAFYHFSFSNMTDFHFSFTKAQIEDSTKINVTYYGRYLPDSLNTIATMKKAVSFIQADLINMGFGTYNLTGFLTYSDSLVDALGIKQQNLTMSTWNEQNSKWEKISSNVDTALNRVSFDIDHLSLFSLVDRTDSLLTDVKEISSQIPLVFDLSQNYPNPFNPQTIIRFQIPQAGFTSISIYNILGQEVKTLISEKLPAGIHEVRWDGTDTFGNKVASGIYIYRMETGTGYVKTRKMVFLK